MKQRAVFWQGHLDGWRASGLTQAAYCANHGVSRSVFCLWRKRERESTSSATDVHSLTLVPVSIQSPTNGSTIRLHSPGGWRIELSDGNTPWLAELLVRLP